jgi:pantetheine-phosphate adenylyltransferase
MKVAIYPGSFDPITKGHLDIIERGLKVFDKLIVAVGESEQKRGLFSVRERMDMIGEVCNGLNVEVDSFKGLLVDYLKKKKCNIVVRALRAISDFENEFQMAITNRKLDPDIEIVFLMTDKEYIYLSSSIVKEIAKHNGDITNFVPKQVEEKLKEKYRR